MSIFAAIIEFESVPEALAFLLPAPIRYEFACTFATEAEFTPSETEYLKRVRPRRRLEFATGRRCAQEALAALGRPRAALGREPDGRPCWPRGVVGSLSHCDGLCVAAVAPTPAISLLGLDVEKRSPLPDGVLELVASPQEIGALGRPPLDIAMFSAKESAFKALYPVVGRYIGFEEMEIAATGDGQFEARLQPKLACEAQRSALGGRFALIRKFVISAIYVPDHK